MTTQQHVATSQPTERSPTSTTPIIRRSGAGRVMFWGLLGVLIVVVGFQAWFLRELRQELAALHKESPVVAGAPDVNLDHPMDSMTAQAWNPFEEMQRMHGLMNEAFDRSIARFRQHPMLDSIVSESIVPSIDVREEPDRFVLKADVPGAKERSVKVELTGQQLTIQGSRESQSEETDSSGHVIRQERETGLFSRSVTLPAPVVAADMKTSVEDGVLTITIPKVSHG